VRSGERLVRLTPPQDEGFHRPLRFPYDFLRGVSRSSRSGGTSVTSRSPRIHAYNDRGVSLPLITRP
jgi:hypothetical protein